VQEERQKEVQERERSPRLTLEEELLPSPLILGIPFFLIPYPFTKSSFIFEALLSSVVHAERVQL
jgi:hypothetical protein